MIVINVLVLNYMFFKIYCKKKKKICYYIEHRHKFYLNEKYN